MKRVRGYILVETLTAMAVLSVTAAAVQQGVYTAIQARGLSQDYTTAQFLMEALVATADLEPWLAPDEVHQGTFEAPNDRFSYHWVVEEVRLPVPLLPAWMTPEQRLGFESALAQSMGRLAIEIRWSRGGQNFAVMGETLVGPGRIWREKVEVR